MVRISPISSAELLHLKEKTGMISINKQHIPSWFVNSGLVNSKNGWFSQILPRLLFNHPGRTLHKLMIIQV